MDKGHVIWMNKLSFSQVQEGFRHVLYLFLGFLRAGSGRRAGEIGRQGVDGIVGSHGLLGEYTGGNQP